MNKRKNYALAVLLLTFILVGLFGFDYVITQIIMTTGQASNDPGTVSLTILGANETTNDTPTPTPGPQKSGRGIRKEVSVSISTIDKINIQSLQLVTQIQLAQ